jgi:hypothetical protein
MTITAAKDVPCVSQTSIWKGFFEAHFMIGEEINQKYPIQNKKWKYSSHKPVTGGSGYGYYYSYYKDWGTTQKVSDPWFRELKNLMPIKTSEMETVFSTTVEGNKVILVIYQTTYV